MNKNKISHSFINKGKILFQNFRRLFTKKKCSAFNVSANNKKIECIEKIFDDFYRENIARGGFGLGLKIVKEICDKNLVIINLQSNEEKTKFTYRFKINENTTA